MIKELTNALRLYAQVERPTYDQLKSIGMTICPKTRKAICQMPDVFSVRETDGYFHTEIARRVNSEKELADWHRYHNTSVRPTNTRSGAATEPVGLPGPPLTPAERRLAGTLSPVDKTGRGICRNYNSHLGCESVGCMHPREFYKNPKQLSWALQIVLAKSGGFKRNKKIHSEKVSDVVREIRQQSAAEQKAKLSPTKKKGWRKQSFFTGDTCVRYTQHTQGVHGTGLLRT